MTNVTYTLFHCGTFVVGLLSLGVAVFAPCVPEVLSCYERAQYWQSNKPQSKYGKNMGKKNTGKNIQENSRGAVLIPEYQHQVSGI